MYVTNQIAQKIVFKSLESWAIGLLRLEMPDGQVRLFGTSGAAPAAHLRLMDDRAFARVLFGGTIGAGESFMAGEWTSDDLPALLVAFIRNGKHSQLDSPFSWFARTAQRARHWLRPNSQSGGSEQNIHEHYDLGNEFYRTFLDESLAYSCAVFEPEDASLEVAQRQKYDRICRKLELGPDDHLLEIGTGWGGFAIHAAQATGCRITTVTISKRQFELACQRVRDAGLDGRITVEYRDYRTLDGQFDKIVSIEMFEAVGMNYWNEYFERCQNLLKPGGKMLLQTITWPDSCGVGFARGASWIHKYIFPGSAIPTVREIRDVLSGMTSLEIAELEEIGSHYVRTLAAWRDRFWESIHDVRALGFTDQFVRTWDFYLSLCQSTFATGLNGDVQLVLR
jgi:cyclopropane-fatty-acyl-phospholipid synthase